MNSWFQPRMFILIPMLGLQGTLLKALDFSFYSFFYYTHYMYHVMSTKDMNFFMNFVHLTNIFTSKFVSTV